VRCPVETRTCLLSSSVVVDSLPVSCCVTTSTSDCVIFISLLRFSFFCRPERPGLHDRFAECTAVLSLVLGGVGSSLSSNDVCDFESRTD